MKIGIIGAGHIGGVLTRRLTRLGHDVTVGEFAGTRDAEGPRVGNGRSRGYGD